MTRSGLLFFFFFPNPLMAYCITTPSRVLDCELFSSPFWKRPVMNKHITPHCTADHIAKQQENAWPLTHCTTSSVFFQHPFPRTTRIGVDCPGHTLRRRIFRRYEAGELNGLLEDAMVLSTKSIEETKTSVWWSLNISPCLTLYLGRPLYFCSLQTPAIV